jgi:hypothetical protein
MAARKTKHRARRAVTRRPATRHTRRASNGGNVWTRQDISFMRKYYKKYPTAWCARQLGRTVYSVRYKASDLCIKKARPSVWRENTSSTKRKTTRRATSRRKVSHTSRTRRSWARRASTKGRKIGRKTTRRTKSRRY